jgi:catechol 2,3-dioxygenase-like lactoylglutathione lyase family enzyme
VRPRLRAGQSRDNPQKEIRMKRFHVHVAVADLDQSIGFYSTLFGVAPSVRKPDYAKWMLDDPRINFAVSQRTGNLGVNHLGLQVDSEDELKSMRDQLQRADGAMLEEAGANCCYAKSDKYWVTDPQGVAWETFHSLGAIPVYGDAVETAGEARACCTPEIAAQPAAKSCCAGAC